MRCFLSANFLVLGEVSFLVRLGKVQQQSQWQPFRWQVLELAPVESGLKAQGEETVTQVTARVFQDELQGYFLNLDTEQPYLFFCLRYPEDNKNLRPEVFEATFSYDEAARWMDSNEEVQTLPLPSAVSNWLAELVQERYKPEPKQRRRPRSFIEPGKRH